MIDALTVICGDALEKLRELPDESVQLTVTSPPYDNLRTYGCHSWDFEGIAKELYRVTCNGGVVCWNVGDSVVDGSETLTSAKQKIFFREQCGFRIHDTMFYEKSNGSTVDPTRYQNCCEYIFVLSKWRPKTFNPIKDKKNITAGIPRFGRYTKRERDGSMSEQYQRRAAEEFGLRTNVWRGNTRAQEEPCQELPQPAMMPKWLAHDLILSWSNIGDTILDPMAGSGTTGREALQLGRNAILIEINSDYIPIIESECSVTMGLALA